MDNIKSGKQLRHLCHCCLLDVWAHTLTIVYQVIPPHCLCTFKFCVQFNGFNNSTQKPSSSSLDLTNTHSNLIYTYTYVFHAPNPNRKSHSEIKLNRKLNLQKWNRLQLKMKLKFLISTKPVELVIYHCWSSSVCISLSPTCPHTNMP